MKAQGPQETTGESYHNGHRAGKGFTRGFGGRYTRG